MVEDEEPEFSAQLTGDISNAELDWLIAELENGAAEWGAPLGAP